jgi:hypothetical protein
MTPGARFEQRAAVVNPALWTGFFAVNGATPIKLLPESVTGPTNLKALAEAGLLSTPLVPHPSLSYGGMTNNLPRDPGAPLTREVAEFSHRDALVWVYTSWQKRDKSAAKGTISAKVYDAQNRLRVHSMPLKATISENAPTRFSISFPPTALERGIYRVDVLWQDQAVWRAFFTIVD